MFPEQNFFFNFLTKFMSKGRVLDTERDIQNIWVSILVTKIKPLLKPNFDGKDGAKNSAIS